MTSDAGYPRFDSWASILDQWRCPAVDRVPVEAERDVTRRCQLYASHDGAHAHAERLPGKRWRSVAHRWNDTGRRWTDKPPERQRRWCCMFSP